MECRIYLKIDIKDFHKNWGMKTVRSINYQYKLMNGYSPDPLYRTHPECVFNCVLLTFGARPFHFVFTSSYFRVND